MEMGKNGVSTLLLHPNITFSRKDIIWNINSSFISKTVMTTSNKFQETKKGLSCWIETHTHKTTFLLGPKLFDIWSLPLAVPSVPTLVNPNNQNYLFLFVHIQLSPVYLVNSSTSHQCKKTFQYQFNQLNKMFN